MMTIDFQQDFPSLAANWSAVKNCFIRQQIPKRAHLLQVGDVADSIYFVQSGYLRLAYNDIERDITLQFFGPEHFVSSFESFHRQAPSQYSIEAITDVTVVQLQRHVLNQLCQQYPQLRFEIAELVDERLIDYTHLFLSRIKDNPQTRYQDLAQKAPTLLSQVPDHYLASYLGITPVSLSRIKKRPVS